MNTVEITQQTKAMIDGLKAVCTNFGLGNAASEYKIITEVFLYKFLNDKFIYEMKKVNPAYADLTDTEVEQRLSALSEDEYEMALMDIGGSTAKLHPKQFISYLFNHQNDDKFHDLFDKTLVAISNDNMDIFSVQAGGASKIKLFDALSPYVIEEEKRDAFCKAMIGKLVNDSPACLSRSMISLRIFLNISSRITTRTAANTPNTTRPIPSPPSWRGFWCRKPSKT